jgi:single-stranded-DNA-specific exonuclease
MERIEFALRKNQRIGIAGDYDCDGITGVAQLLRFFLRRGVRPTVYLPHRVKDGYGLKPSIITAMGKLDLLMTVDTGVVAHEAIALARERGTDVIVIDHHHLPQNLPKATHILHPILLNLPTPHPCASGLVHMLLRVMAKKNGQAAWEGFDEDCALAAIGTIADLVPLQGNNRALAQEGIAALKRLQGCPLATIRERVASAEEVRSSDVAFRIAPRINAAGRMADPHIALEAILRGGKALDALEQLNAERQKATEEILTSVLASLPQSLPPAIMLMHEAYHPGIIGLIAGKLAEKTGRPSLVASLRGEQCTASLRSPGTYNLVEGLARCAHLLESYGGHAQAAGCTFLRTQGEALREAFYADVHAQTHHRVCVPSKTYDVFLPSHIVNASFCKAMEALEPFGQGNPEPRFVLQNVTCANLRRIGGKGAHLQSSIQGIAAVGFGLGPSVEAIPKVCDALCRVGMNRWNGSARVQLFIEDIREAERGESVAVEGATPERVSLPSRRHS